MPAILIAVAVILLCLGLYGLHARRAERRDARRQVVENLLRELRGLFMRRVPVRCKVDGTVAQDKSLVSIRPPHGGEVILTRDQVRRSCRYGICSRNVTGFVNFAAQLPSGDFPGGEWYKRPLEELFGILAHKLQPPDPRELQAFREARDLPHLN